MNKTQLVDAIASEAKITKVDAKKALEAFVSVTEKALKNGEKISLVGFGSFTAIDKPARNGRNPRTGEAIVIESKKVIKFKAGVELLDAMK